MKTYAVCVVGNPNCGKTTLFNALTGGRAEVGNWPGVTVEKKVGRYEHRGKAVDLVDLPGVYSLALVSEAAEDERIARDFILSGEAAVVLNIVDASNLERNLYLTTQLLEMRQPMVLAVNMMDVAASRRLAIDLKSLSADLGCPVVPLVAHRGKGLEALRDALDETWEQGLGEQGRAASGTASYGADVERTLEEIAALLPDEQSAKRRWIAVRLLEDDLPAGIEVPAAVRDKAAVHRRNLESAREEDVDVVLADARYGFAGGAARRATTRKGELSRTLSERIDRIALHRLLGIPLFLAAMYAMFVFTIHIGGAFIDVFEQTAGLFLVEGVDRLLSGVGAPDWTRVLLSRGVGGGIQTVATFIPIIGCLYLFLSALEDSGYMARAAFVMDRFMQAVGLPGKAFVPLIVGFGCTVPAVMATRTLDSRRDRLIAVAMAPFMSCGARLPIYVLFASSLFPSSGQNLVFALYLIGLLTAVGVGLLLKTTLLRGESSPFVMELPPYHVPTLSGLLTRTWERLRVFVLQAGRLIVLIVTGLSFLNSLGTDGSFGNEDTDRSVLASIGKTVTPVFAPMGLNEDNWPATVGIFTGIFAKEAVVGTLNALYDGMAKAEAEEEQEEDFDLWGGMLQALATVPENLKAAAARLGDPIGIVVGDLSDAEAAADSQDVSVGTLGMLARMFDGQIGALAYLVMILLYMPCVATTATIWREVGGRWLWFVAVWTTGLGYGGAVLTYRIGTFFRDPAASALAVATVLAALGGVILLLRRQGRKTGLAFGRTGARG